MLFMLFAKIFFCIFVLLFYFKYDEECIQVLPTTNKKAIVFSINDVSC